MVHLLPSVKKTGALVRAIALLSVSGLPFGGCTGCEETPTPSDDTTIGARFPSGASVAADGVSRLPFVVNALDKKGDPETAAITVSIRDAGVGGTLFLGTAEDGNVTVTSTPDENGNLEVEYRCAPEYVGPVVLTLENPDVKGLATITCEEPSGPISVVVDASACEDVQADGVSSCEIKLTAQQAADTGTILVAGADVTVAIVSTGEENDVLSASPGGDVSDGLRAVTGADGTASFFFNTIVDVAEAYDISIQVERNGQQSTRVFSIAVDEFTDESDITFEQPSLTVVGGQLQTITAHFVDIDGGPLANADVNFAVVGGEDADPALSVATATTDVDGNASVDLATVAVDEPVTLQVVFSFTNAVSLPISEALDVEVVSADALAVNVDVSKGEIRSDLDRAANDGDSTVTAVLTKSGIPVANGSVRFVLESSSLSSVTLSGDTAADGDVTVATNASGEAAITVTANLNVPPATILMDVISDDDEPGDPVQRQIAISLVRDPVVSTLTPQSPVPGTIGVRGGALPSSTSISFIVSDDRGNPVPRIPVRFEKSTTADPGIVVTPNTDVSDSSGTVTAVLSAATIAGPVTLTARIAPNVGGLDRELVASSQPVAIVGGLPSFQHSYMVCADGEPIAVTGAFSVGCQVVLADRFNNAVSGLAVQFRSEGAVVAPVSTSSDDGAAQATFVAGSITQSGPSVSDWSYGVVVPTEASDLLGFAGAAACFDGTSATPCDLVELCSTPGLEPFCPLPPDCNVDASVALLDAPPTPLEFGLNTGGARDAVTAYVANHRQCGFPVSCLTGQADIAFLDGDECSAHPGCFDFTTATECPQDSVLTFMGSSRGEESFDDLNGDNVFGIGEKFVDMPEPFLDKNDNCARDDMTHVSRYDLTPVRQVQHTDMFSDVDQNGVYGFGPLGAEPTLTNGVWDLDTELFFASHILVVNTSARLTVGALCDPAAANAAGNVPCAATGGQAHCTEVAPGVGIAEECFDTDLSAGESATLFFRWDDGTGNCPSPDFSAESTVTLDGSAELAGQESVTLSSGRCGFAQILNPILPHCSAVPFLGAPIMSVSITADCPEGAEPSLATAEFAVGEDNAETRLFNVCVL